MQTGGIRMERIEHIDGDVRDCPALREVFKRCQPDIAFHLAAQSLVLESYNDPALTFATNVMGTVHFLEAVRATPSVRAAVVITSDKCYENRGSQGGFREGDPLGGRDPYSASKAAAEMVVSSYIHLASVSEGAASIASVRAGNVLGGGDWRADRIMPDCMRALEEGRPVTVRNPDSIRPWQHVLEPLCGYLELGARLFGEGRAYEGAWNFGPAPGNFVTVRELVEEVIARKGEGDYAVRGSAGEENLEARVLYLDISKARDGLDWKPRLDITAVVAYALDEYDVEGMDAREVFEQRLEHIRDYGDVSRGRWEVR